MGIVSTKKPVNNHLWIETNSSGTIYIVPVGDTDSIYKTTDKCSSWGSSLSYGGGYAIKAFYHDRTNNKLYYICDDGDAALLRYIDLTNDSDNNIQSFSGGANGDYHAYDVNYIDDTIRWAITFDDDSGGVNDGLTMMLFWEDSPSSHSWSMGAWIGRTHDMSFVTEDDAGNGWLLWQWSNEDAELWKYDESVGTFVQMSFSGGGNLTGASISSDKNLCGIAYDGSNVLYFVLDVSGTNFLYSYSISTDIITKLGEYDVSLMLDRNTVLGVMEKAFHLTEYKVYQLHPYALYQLYYISKVDTDAVLIAITDNFLMNNDGDVFEYEDMSSYLTRVEFAHEIMYYSEGILGVNRDKITIEKGMFIQIESKYTTAGSSSDEIVFEGIVADFDGERLTKVWIDSPAKKELLKKKPRGSFSGRSDEIMTTLLSAYCKYTTKGTFSTGTAMGTVKYAGDKSLLTILIELAKFEKWIFALTPQGQLNFNDGTIDSLVDLSSANKIWKVKSGEIREPYNYFYIKGAIVSGIQLYKEIEAADDLTSQELYGYNPEEKTYASFNTQSILNQLTTNIKTVLKETPLVVEFWHYDASIGMIAINETVTFVYDTTNVNITSDQFLINKILFKAKQNAGGYIIADKFI